MRTAIVVCTLWLLIIGIAAANPIVKRAIDNDINPVNEVYVFANEDEPSLEVEDEHGDREKRKIGIIKLGVSNGIINFVFGKLDAFLDAKTRAITILDQGNRAKNAAYGIDNTQSATSEFIGNLIGQKIKAGTAGIGPLLNSATTLISGATSGITGAFASKLAPLSSIAGGLSAGTGSSGGTSGSGNILGTLLSGLSGSSGGLGSLSGGNNDADDNVGGGGGGGIKSSSGSRLGAGAGVNLGAFANLGGGGTIESTTEDIPEFDRNRVSLDVPSAAFGTGFTVVTNVSKIFSSIILNSARRTQSVLEVFKPLFRGVFAIKGLPSDRKQ